VIVGGNYITDPCDFLWADLNSSFSFFLALETNAKVYKLSGCAETFSLNYCVYGK
jgi:hypothetical protein